MRLFLLGLIAGLPALAAEMVVLTTGARVPADHHEWVGDTLRLYKGSGVSEFPARLVAAFEAIPDPPPPPFASPALPFTAAVKPVAEAAKVFVEPVVEPKVRPESMDPLELIRAAALREGLPPEFVASVARVESALRTDAISPKGAIGVMQLMPGTAKDLGADPYDVRQNIDAGTRLLRDLLIKYDGDVVKALSAYNAGPGAVAKYNGIPPYDETIRYVTKVIHTYQKATATAAATAVGEPGAGPAAGTAPGTAKD